MDRPLHTFKKLVEGSYLILFILMIWGANPQQVLAQNFQTNECNCLDNATQPGDGQFMETFSFNSGDGETWMILSASNFFDPITTTPGNPVPFVLPKTIDEVMLGFYSIDAIRVEGAPWNITISDGNSEFDLSSFHTCIYPDSTIYGDLGNCINTFDTYNVDISDDDLVSIQWSLPGGGGIFITPDNENNVEIEWGGATGTFPLTVDVIANPPGASSLADDCTFSSTIMVEILDEVTVPMACNNEVQVSLSPLCSMDLTPSTILEAMELTEASYDIILRDIEADTIVNQYAIDNSYVGKRLEVTILHECSFNSCWGYLVIEDKAASPLMCGPDIDIDCDMLEDPLVTGFPLPPSAIVTPIRDRVFMVENYDPCGDGILRYEDTRSEGLCEGPYSAIITRAWSLTDQFGNTSRCSTLININRAFFEDIVYPENWDDATGPNPSLEACGGWEETERGAPAPSVTGSPIGVQCLNATVEFEDVFLPKCDEANIDNTFKVIRRWWVRDHCTGQDSIHVQYISVLDRTPPVVTLPEEIIVNTSPYSCGAQIQVPVPEVEECSIYDYAISYRLKDVNGEPLADPIVDGIWRDTDGSYIIEELPPGQKEIWVIYSVYDICNNVTEEVAEIIIIDNEEPVPVCDQYSYVALKEEGMAWAGPSTFDDGSWDNCGIEKMEVRRMESSACGVTSSWADKVKFCCEDIGTDVMVSLRVTDYASNSNTCMVIVRVQDNRDPEWVTFPDDEEIDCDVELGDFSQFGMATATDNCGDTVTVENVPNLNACGLGRVERIFTATDDAGNTITRIQNIFIVNKDLFSDDHIDWPDDVTLPNGCLNGGLDPDNLPAGSRYPILRQTSCSNTLYDYEDLEFQYSEGACTKIIRKWTVIDWCQFDPFDPSKGKYFKNQIIKVLNSESPEIIEGCSGIQNVEQLDGCSVIVTLIAQATDDCTASKDLIWRYEIDIGNNGIIDKTGNDNDASTIFSFGTHKITWYVTDECGNESTCSNVFSITDEKKPTPVCFEGIVTVIMDVTGTVTIWAKDFDKGSYDNCGGNTNVKISFSPDTTNTWRTFTCSDLNGKSIDTIELRMYVTDSQGNNEYCNTTIIIQDNKNACGFNEIVEEKVAVSGAVYTDNEEMVSGVDVAILSDSPEFPLTFTTEGNGEYAFSDLSIYKDYILEPSKVDAYLNGVSTLDIVLIQRHILGIQELDSPYKIIAADVNNSQKVSAADIIQLRKLILGIYQELPENDSWRFVDKNFEFGDWQRPFPFNEKIQIEEVKDDMTATDFVGIKVGDVNDTALNSNARSQSSRSTFPIIYTYRFNQLNKTVEYTFTTDELIAVEGFQLSLNIEGINHSSVEVIGKEITLDENNYAIDNETITISYNGVGNSSIRGNLFSIIVSKHNSRDIQPLGLSSFIDAEMYLLEGGEVATYPISIKGKQDFQDMLLMQNTPNPFKETTLIRFVLPNESDVTLRIMDLTGRVLYNQKTFLPKGRNGIKIDATEIDAQGILYYQIETTHHSLTKKMIHIK